MNAIKPDREDPIKKLEIGDIVVICERGLKHTIDRIVQRTKKWHHVMLYIGKGMVLEVTPRKGCHIAHLMPTLRRCIEFKVLRAKKLSAGKKKLMVTTAIKLFNSKKFSTVQIIKILMFREFPFLNKLYGSKLSYVNRQCDTKRVICSNMISLAYCLFGVRISTIYKPEHIIPRDFEDVQDFDTVLERKQQSL